MLAGGYAEVVQYQSASADVALFDAFNGEEEAFVHSVRPFPFHLVPAYQPVMPWPSAKQSVDKDFVLVCEFSEIIGPSSLITIPRDGGKNFDKDSFAVKIMAVDYNATNTLRCYARFTIVEDTSVIIEDKEEKVYAYVHHFTLYDVDARGYVRPFCMAYITPDKNKLFKFLEKLMSKFKAVSHLFRSGNQLLFKTDLEQRLADLCYTRESLQLPSNPVVPKTSDSSCLNNGFGEEEGMCHNTPNGICHNITNGPAETGIDEEEDGPILDGPIRSSKEDEEVGDLTQLTDGPCQRVEVGDSTQLTDGPCQREEVGGSTQLTDGPCQREEVGGSTQLTDGPCQSTILDKTQRALESLNKNIKDCQDMLKELRKKMEHSSFPSGWKKTHSSSPSTKRGCDECSSSGSGYHSDGELINISGEGLNICRGYSKSLSSLCKNNCHCLGRPYQPKMVKVDFRRYDISLKSLQKLCGNLGTEAINKLQKLYNVFSRDAVVLKLEQIEAGLISPSSSLLTIGRTVQTNFLANLHVQSSLSDGLSLHSRGRGNNMVGTPTSTISNTSDTSIQSYPLSYDVEFVPGSTAASLDSLYYDVDERLDDLDSEKMQENDDTWLEISISTTGEKASYEEKSIDYNRSISDGISLSSCSETEDMSTQLLLNGGAIPFVNGFGKGPHLSSPTEPVVSRCSKVPVGCYASRLSSTNVDLPGIGIKALLYQYPYSIHLIYAILSGRTVVIAAGPQYEREVYQVIRTLLLFVPGHSSDQLIVPWHTKPLTMCDLGRMKLVGLAKTKSLQRVIPASVFRFSTVFDYESARLWTPCYKGTILLKTLSQCKNFRHDQTCIAAIEAMMMNYATKAFLYYHTYCLNSNSFHTASDSDRNQLTASSFLAKIDVVQGDAKIIQYWVDLIKQQQISEFLSRTTSSATAKMSITLDYQASNFYHL